MIYQVRLLKRYGAGAARIVEKRAHTDARVKLKRLYPQF